MTTYNTIKDLDAGAVDFTTPVNTDLLFLAHVAVNFATAPEAAETITIDIVNAIGTLYGVNLLKYVSTAGLLTTLTLIANAAIPVTPGSAVRVRVTNASQSAGETNDDPTCYVTVTMDATERTGEGWTLLVNGRVDSQGSAASGGDALTTNPLSQFAATTSAQLAGVITNETGTGLLVFNTNSALVTPDLGTPSAIVLTNATGLPLTGLLSLGAGVATFLTTPLLANLNTAVSDADLARLASNTFTAGQTIATGIVTANIPILDVTQTWNNGAVTFTALKANITDTASAAGSLLFDLQSSGVSQFWVKRLGKIRWVNTGYSTSNVNVGPADNTGFSWSGASGPFIINGGVCSMVLDSIGVSLSSTAIFGWNVGVADATFPDSKFSRTTAPGVALNAVDASPVATDPILDFQVSGASKAAILKSGGLRMLDAANSATTTIKAAAGVAVTGGTNRDLTFLTGTAARTITLTGDVTLPQTLSASGPTLGEVIALARQCVRY